MPRRRSLALLPVVLVLTAGCGQLQFEQDRRLEFDGPKANALTALPVTVSWTAEGAAPGRGSFVLFVDRAPMKVGESLGDLVDGVARPSAEELAQQDVYVTRSTRLTLTRVTDTDVRSSRQRHEVTIVLVDSRGERVRESSWTRSFDLRKAGTT